MATQNQSLDSVITVKVNYDGSTRRAKMALRDTAPKVLEQEIRNFLHIPAETAIILERYSDSAASYVLLEPHNTAVYKQLYRAAKAKSKLKLRVSLKPQETAAAPKPVSMEDILEAAPPQISTEPLVPAPTSESAPSTLSRTYDFNTLARAAKICESDMLRQSFDSSEKAPVIKDDSPPPYAQGWPQLAPVFAICCNSCEKTTPMVHYHCSTCDDGDFDLCEDCVAKGISCYGSDHWMVKRTRVNGQIVNSTTERIAPKPKLTQPEPKKEEKASQGMSEPAAERKSHFSPTTFDAKSALASLQENLAKLEIQTAARVGRVSMRTCNQCIQELPEADFLHCDACEDYDLCRECFSKDSHGHHPQHAFSPAVSGATFSASVNSKLAPGRNKVHNAICDNCDKYITGIRHKCLDCPDWDYCADCVPNAVTTHPGHRFVPVYGALKSNYNFLPAAQHVHVGICCDGPLCSNSKSYPAYIRGVRYKCAVCHDLDFCASCEANPTNTHNKTHPLIKFNLPVRHVSVTTHGEGANGQQMPVMGDHIQRAPEAAQPAPQSPSKLSAPRTVVDTKPQPPSPKISLSAGFEKEQQKKNLDERHDSCQDMRATFLRDTVQDGTIVSPDQVFEQTWVLRNDGRDTWPAGCAVRFVGGDYMGSMSSKNAAASKDLVKASMTNSTTKPVGPGEEMGFTVKLRAPPRPGKTISFWRLATPSGHMFGHRLWCEIKVRTMPPAASPAPAAPVQDEVKPELKSEDIQESEEDREVRKALNGPKVNSSQMIFPKLEKESPEASMHQESTATPSQTDEKSVAEDDFEDCSKETDWDGSDDDFLTDEEYDILDASDEEFLEEQTKKASS